MFCISSVGRRTGEAIVVMETPEQAELGIKRHKFFIESRYIEVCNIDRCCFFRDLVVRTQCVIMA